MSDGGGTGTGAGVGAVAILDGIAAMSRQQSGSENFPVALRLVPRRPRAHLMRIYTFARFVDDVGDEAPGDRLALLDLVEQDVRGLLTGCAQLPPVAGLAAVRAECELGIEPLLDLIEANRRDQRIDRYASFDDLLGYCRLSAAPVGRLVLGLAGVDDPAAQACSDAICAALQVLEHCQDVGEDAQAGRVYLPVADLRAAGVDDADLLLRSTSPQLRSVVALHVERARTLMRTGRPLLRRLHGWARLAVTGYLAGGVATADALERAGYDVLAGPVRPRAARTARSAARLMVSP